MDQADIDQAGIELKIDSYTFSEAIQSRRYINRRSWTIWGSKAIALFVLLACLNWVRAFINIGIPFTLMSYLIPIAGATWGAVHLFDLLYIYQVRRYFKAMEKDESLKSPQHIELNHDGIFLQTNGLTKRFGWGYFQKARETTNHFFLPFYREPDYLYWMLPKRCFQSIEDIDAARKILNKQVTP